MKTEEALCARLLNNVSDRRQLIAIAGPPGGGKSTLSHILCDRLNGASPGLAAIVPMDGFHFDDAVLKSRGVLDRKGAPFTFDVGGMKSILQRLKNNDEAEVAVPVFDRSIEISRGSAQIISRDTLVILVEGNYLLLDEEPWKDLQEFYDYSVMISVPFDELESRLIGRWLEHGFTLEQATERARANDLVNAKIVLQKSREADFYFHQEGRCL